MKTPSARAQPLHIVCGEPEQENEQVRHASGWTDKIAVTEKGLPRASVGNAGLVLQHHPLMRERLAFNEREGRPVWLAPAPWDVDDDHRYPRHVVDVDFIRCAQWAEQIRVIGIPEGIFVRPEVWCQAIVAEAHRHLRFDPVRHYLMELAWDGRPRIDQFAVEYLGAQDTPYARAVGAKTLIAGVARTLQPGCKVDTMLVLDAPQGRFKSTAIEVLVGKAWFTDQLPDLRTKDAAVQLQGPWIIEIGELAAMKREEVETIKGFMSRTSDDFRAPYGKGSEKHPRRTIFIGTTNAETYLRDETGNRRFWPLKVAVTRPECDVDAIRHDRDQLWAEAVVRFRAGERWYLDAPELVRAAAAEQDARYQEDAWEPLVARYCEGRERVTISGVLSEALQIEPVRQGQVEQNRVVRALRRMQWSKRRVREGGRLLWVYEAPYDVTEDET